MADPYRNFKFEVEIAGTVRAGFKSVSGLDQTTENIKYREGGDNETSRKLPGPTEFGDITLERGASDDNDFVNWIREVYDARSKNGEQGGENFRRTPIIYLKNKAGVRVKKWTIKKAWPINKNTGDLDAMGNDVLMEKLVLTNEGIVEENLAP